MKTLMLAVGATWWSTSTGHDDRCVDPTNSHYQDPSPPCDGTRLLAARPDRTRFDARFRRDGASMRLSSRTPTAIVAPFNHIGGFFGGWPGRPSRQRNGCVGRWQLRQPQRRGPIDHHNGRRRSRKTGVAKPPRDDKEPVRAFEDVELGARGWVVANQCLARSQPSILLIPC